MVIIGDKGHNIRGFLKIYRRVCNIFMKSFLLAGTYLALCTDKNLLRVFVLP